MYDPSDPSTWPIGDQNQGGLINLANSQETMGAQDLPSQSWSMPSPDQFSMYGQDQQFNFSSIPDDLFKSNIPEQENKGVIADIGKSLSDLMKKRGGEIFVNAMAGSAMGVLNYLSARRKARGESDMLDKKFQYERQLANERVARASAVPQFGSVVKQGVTGRRELGNRQTVQPSNKYVGLIGG